MQQCNTTFALYRYFIRHASMQLSMSMSGIVASILQDASPRTSLFLEVEVVTINILAVSVTACLDKTRRTSAPRGRPSRTRSR